MHCLQKAYDLQRQDAEVRHRWCELVVKHRFSQAYIDVEHFLIHDQAMGVYLYGELMLQEDARQQALARHCLEMVQEEMDQSVRRVVEEMNTAHSILCLLCVEKGPFSAAPSGCVCQGWNLGMRSSNKPGRKARERVIAHF
ncbi:hypothetical protein WMY93_005176 [Mugilogobius chulae]|uniref:Peptidase M1 leukotriene A4 hydrolase/aminopeptidase C-terminal domain-containing protein n=1 Tax=Mugilogobius chulae TaxID=88201 RepID=A0AAW0Q5I5_9GOBI